MTCFDIRIIKQLYFLDVLKAWDYAQTIPYSEKRRIAYIKAEKDTREHIFFDISKVRSQPAGAFWADKTVF